MSKHTPGRLTTPDSWLRYNALTHTYDTPDGTTVPTELADNVECLADVLRIADIRASQRAAIAAEPIATVKAALDAVSGAV